ncbi:hypothetical protein K443DRAFT_686633 [Laccaria amethystina LaAM-08-1]|uniref:Uncharacterized protein n=1 Tax=Laccaria amethystina LaAM-08-1 TaxID=1095629 RepID=A0A0C9WLV2_9AGAR|nr:hypothetical protein K443DRAFT_686633 [Laccaria amethystina LaAM-08-1]
MSAHALLAMNNPGVVVAFFEGIRAMLDGSGHTDEVVPSNAAHDGSLRAVDEAIGNWRDLDLARGNGREKGKARERQ